MLVFRLLQLNLKHVRYFTELQKIVVFFVIVIPRIDRLLSLLLCLGPLLFRLATFAASWIVAMAAEASACSSVVTLGDQVHHAMAWLSAWFAIHIVVTVDVPFLAIPPILHHSKVSARLDR